MIGLGSIDSHFLIASTSPVQLRSALINTACAVLWSDVPPNTQPPKAELSLRAEYEQQVGGGSPYPA